jgi:thiol-disulfide isomerase/thioredoxin
MTRRRHSAQTASGPRSSPTWLAIRLLAGLVALGGIALVLWWYTSPGKYDDFAKCLTDKGAKFYGAFWCPHCQAQKKMFGRSAKYLPYVECSTPNGKGQLEVCKEKRIDGYPLWEFADGERKSGEVSVDELSRKTSCPLPKPE